MNPELTVEEVIAQGRRAGDLLNDPVFAGVLSTVERSYYKAWLGTADREEQFAAWSSIHAISEIGKALRVLQERGYVAEQRLALS